MIKRRLNSAITPAARARWLVPLAIATIAVPLAGCGGDDELPGPAARIQPTNTSWIPGQDSLLAFADYLGIAKRVSALALARIAGREAALERIERLRQRAKRAERLEALRKYCQALREAARQIREAHEEAKRQREAAIAKLKRQRARALAIAARERREHAIEPGEECEIPEVHRFFTCERGYPYPKPEPQPLPELPPLPPPAPPPDEPANCDRLLAHGPYTGAAASSKGRERGRAGQARDGGAEQ